VWGGLAVSYADKTVTAHYSELADPDRTQAFLAELAQAATGLPWPVVPVAVPLSERELQETVGEVMQDGEGWAERLGLADVTMVGSSADLRAIEIHTSQPDVPQTDITVNGLPIKVIGGTQVELNMS
jgi:hypothetical protein